MGSFQRTIKVLVVSMKLNQNTNYNGLLLVWTRVREKKKLLEKRGERSSQICLTKVDDYLN